MAEKLKLNTVTMDDLNGHLIEFKRFSDTANVYYAGADGYHHIFKIEDNQAFDFNLNTKTGKLEQDKKPIVKLEKITVPDPDKTGATKEVDGVAYIAVRNVQDPYVGAGEIHRETFIGEPAVAFIQGLKQYLQSLQFFSYDTHEASEVFILDSVQEIASTSTTTTSTTTSTTTKQPEETTTTTSTTVKPADEKPAK
ncbi:hypothetical protein GPK34_00505 [Secundilactobacillus kimchicus]|uniref:hypothetical protein n=1 Tax=Secundilactobacillus kimchicus TaxID=528209 RepID=UPI001C039463|nr:hypothetical protein [Secundilactobacillus kimchicus]MBT9670518.1 hypothetical protein [Secundilactobacillus kimchicus]